MRHECYHNEEHSLADVVSIFVILIKRPVTHQHLINMQFHGNAKNGKMAATAGKEFSMNFAVKSGKINRILVNLPVQGRKTVQGRNLSCLPNTNNV